MTATLQAATGVGVPLLDARTEKSTSEGRPQTTASTRTAEVEASHDLELSVAASLQLVRESLNRIQNPARPEPSEILAGSPASQDTSSFPAGLTENQPEQLPVFSATSVNPDQQLQTPIRTEPHGRKAIGSNGRSVIAGSWQLSAVLLLCVVCSVGLLWFCVEWLLFLRSTRGLQPASWQQLKLLDQLRQCLEVTRRIELLTSDHFSEPVAFGVWRWRIVLPRDLDSRLSEAELQSLLAHEIAHLARGDVLWLHIGRLLTSVLAWQPLNFVARRQWQLHAEFQSDDWAINRAVDPVSLARCLTIVAEWRSAQRLGSVALSAGGSRSHITDRVERLLAPAVTDTWSSGRRRTVLALAFLLTAGSLAVAGPGFSRREYPESARGLPADTVSTDLKSPAAASEEEAATNPVDDIEAQLKSESASLALEISLLADELAELEEELASAMPAPAIQKSADRLRRRLAMLRGIGATSDRSITTSKTD